MKKTKQTKTNLALWRREWLETCTRPAGDELAQEPHGFEGEEEKKKSSVLSFKLPGMITFENKRSTPVGYTY